MLLSTIVRNLRIMSLLLMLCSSSRRLISTIHGFNNILVTPIRRGYNDKLYLLSNNNKQFSSIIRINTKNYRSGLLAFSTDVEQTNDSENANTSKASIPIKNNLFSTENSPKKILKRTDPITLTNIPKVILKRTKQRKTFREGNQLVFTRAIKDGNYNKLKQGILVLVSVETETINQEQALGLGVYNNESLYKVRILVHKYIQPTLYENIIRTCITENDALTMILQHNIKAALKLRQALGLGIIDSSSNTDTYRLVNGEGDSLSGLAIDIIGGTVAVVMSSASWCEIHKDIIITVLRDVLSSSSSSSDNIEVVWKTTPSRLQQDGYINLQTSNNNINNNENDIDESIDNDIDESDDENNDNNNESQIMIVSKENGIIFETYPYEIGQKTGVYCDQRENRLYLSQYCRNKNVLDLCCYHGGFSITASVLGKAASVTGVDSSLAAITTAKINALLNNCNKDTTNFIQADIADYLQKQYIQNIFYDVIVLDPPKLAPNVKLLDKARRKYHALNRDAIKVINKNNGGFLFSCTCSAAMTEAEGGQYFISMVQGAALAAGRQVTLVQTRGAASCHTISPICSPAGAYLTATLFFVHPISD